MTGVAGETWRSISSSAFLRLLSQGPSVDERQPVHPSRKMIEEDVFFDAEIREETQLLVNEGDAESERIARIRRRDLFSGELDTAAVPGSTPPRMFIVVDLPEPFSPTRPRTAPASSSKSDVAQHLDAEEALVEPADLEEQVGHRLAARHQRMADRVGHGRQQNDAAFDRVDRRQRQAEKLQAVVDRAEKQHAEQDADDRPLAAEQTDAPDHRRADHVEQDPLPEDRRSRFETRRVDDRRKSREQAR